jgi:hypothetical protein
MNIIDIVSGSIKPQQNEIANKIAVKSEMKRIEGRVEQIMQDVLRYYTDESDYINNNLSYSSCIDSTKRILSQEDKDTLLKKLEETIKAIPEKLKENLNDIFTSSSEEKPKDSENTEENPSRETTASVQIQQPVASTTGSIFGY